MGVIVASDAPAFRLPSEPGSAGFGWLSDDFGPSGVIGDATIATADRGKVAFEEGVRHLVEALAEVAAFDFPDRRTPDLQAGET